jgi:hypothetical protein
LLSKGGVRKAQKEKLQQASFSIDNVLNSMSAIEHKLSDLDTEDAAKSGAATPNSEAGGSTDAQSDGLLAASTTTAKAKETKVQWDQLLRDDADDCEMLEEFICKICQVHVVGCEPKLARCSHLFCGDCIATWFAVQPRSQSWAQRAQSAGLVPCPVCKEPLHEENDLFTVGPKGQGQNESALLWRLLSGVKIVCANSSKCRSDGRCTWVGGYGEYQKHIQTCANVPLDSAPSYVRTLASNATARTNHLPDSAKLGSKSASDKAAAKEEHVKEAAAKEARVEDNVAPLREINEASAIPAAIPAVRCFSANGPSQLGIQAGELIQVLNLHQSGWTYGRKVIPSTEPKSNEESVGWFPNWVIA